MRRVLRRQGPREGNVMVQSPEESLQHDKDHERISSLVKKPFRCLVGGGRDDFEKEYADLHQVVAPDEQYVPPGGESDYGFEAIVQESKKKKKGMSFRKKDKSTSMEELPPPPSAHRRNRSLEEPPRFNDSFGSYSSFPRIRSFEDLPSGVELDSLVNRTISGSFADAIPPGKKNDPLDTESIRDVSKALREMERKLEAAGTEGKKVSRTKVMKALLTVVDQLGEENDSRYGIPPSNPSSSANTSADLYRTWGGNADAIALDRQRRNLEQMRELTITPQKDYSGRAESPWKGDKPSFSKMNAELKAVATDETEAEPDYVSSSSDEDEEEETLFSEETEESRRSKKKKKQGSQKGSFPHAVYDEETLHSDDKETLHSDDTSQFRVVKKVDRKRGKSKKGSFAHAVSPSAANPNTSFDLFSLDMRDPAVHDALSDLLWIPSPSKSIMEATSKAAVVSPEQQRATPIISNRDDVLHKMRKRNQRMISYQSESEYYDKPDIGEETTTATTQSSYTVGTSTSQQQQQKKSRESSWWRRNQSTALKPPSRDTPNVAEQQSRPPVETRVTVTQSEDLDPWRPHHRWEER